LSVGDACRMFFKQVEMHKGLPFEARIPNAETVTAFAERAEGGGKKSTLQELREEFKALGLK
jgi:DNA-damage-inducible protein J